ncbi:ATP-grasp domain-containing protein [Marinobacter bohaiensis]|uniref:ATP-grasp domain-containing protein n=1 Tax=Marinobacter bohaiensis TaxID=2201898 RepID=UPI000DAC5628|nr:ATP-grasp domain-containing protein [Marinobacter bohaiensis]
MKPLYFVLQNIVTFRSDFKNLANEARHDLVLITGELGLSNLGNDQKKFFADIVVTDPFDFRSITEEIHRYLTIKTVNDLNDVRILCNDEYHLGTAAHLRQHFGITGALPDTIRLYTNKLDMKKSLAASGIRLPHYLAFDPVTYKASPAAYTRHIEAKLGYPVFAKPVDSAGSEGVRKLDSRPELEAWLSEHATTENYELDEFLQGTLYHIDAVNVGGQSREIFVSENAYPNACFLEGLPMGSIPIASDSDMYARLVAFNARVVEALGGAPSGATHLEVFVTLNDELVFLEIAARAPGGWIPQMHHKRTGNNIEEQHFRAQMGVYEAPDCIDGLYAAWMWYPKIEGVRLDASHPLEIESPYQVAWDVSEASAQTRPASIRDKVGGILLWNDDLTHLRRDFFWLRDQYRPYRQEPVAPVSIEPVLAHGTES